MGDRPLPDQPPLADPRGVILKRAWERFGTLAAQLRVGRGGPIGAATIRPAVFGLRNRAQLARSTGIVRLPGPRFRAIRHRWCRPAAITCPWAVPTSAGGQPSDSSAGVANKLPVEGLRNVRAGSTRTRMVREVGYFGRRLMFHSSNDTVSKSACPPSCQSFVR